MAETRKALARRIRDGFFTEFIPVPTQEKPGIDIGCSIDPLFPECPNWRCYDKAFGDGDATFMADVPDESYASVYASHILEHLNDPQEGIRNWFRILRPGGCLVICVPHRELYEKRTELPSQWNGDHKYFWLPEGSDPESSCTLGLREIIDTALFDGAAFAIPYTIEYITVLDENFVSNGPTAHSGGEYSIEAVIRKL